MNKNKLIKVIKKNRLKKELSSFPIEKRPSLSISGEEPDFYNTLIGKGG